MTSFFLLYLLPSRSSKQVICLQSTFVLTRSCVLAILKVTNKKTFLIRILINCGLFLKTLRLDSFLFPCRLSHNAANYVISHCFSKICLKSRNRLRHPIFFNSNFFEQGIIYLHIIDVAFLYEFETKLRINK